MTQAANEPWVWVPLALILAVHDEQLTHHGGLQGVRDEGLLVSALARAQHLASYGAPDVAQLAAAYAFGVVRNHPFVDGNKRTAFAVTYTFLAINGGRIVAEALPTHAFIIGLYEAGTFDFEHLVAWLRSNVSAG
mgnify:CR=1 FL=1